MDTIVSGFELSGRLTLPPFKSQVIRLLILNALVGIKPCSVLDHGVVYCDDIVSAAKAVEQAFCDAADPDEPIFVGASAALIRMLAPIMLFKAGSARFACEASLMRRDMSELIKGLGCAVTHDHSHNIITFSGGRLNGEYYTVHAERSSQFASGMLIASAVNGFRVRIVSPVSVPYIELTLECLKRFGCEFKKHSNGYLWPIGRLHACERSAFMPDSSYAANFIAAGFIRGVQKRIVFEGCNADMELEEAVISELLVKNKVDVSNCPDLFPLLAVCALNKSENTFIVGTGRLRDKESDRVASVSALVSSLGGRMEEYSDSVVIHGCGGKLRGGTVDGFGDHRIVMAASIASLMCSEPVLIKGAEAVSKSAPGFFDDFRSLGGEAYEYDRN